MIWIFLIVSDLNNRPRSVVCGRYNSEYARRATNPVWEGVSTGCAVGTHKQGDRDDTIRRINVYRFLCGLRSDTTLDDSFTQECAEAATVMDANNKLSHYIDSSYTCFTEPAKEAAKTSNLALGMSDSTYTIDMYINDNGVVSLGHRRWVLHPALKEFGLGFRRRAGVLKVINVEKNTSNLPSFFAYPSGGPFPIGLIYSQWSFHSDSLFSNATVKIMRSDNVEVPTTIDVSNMAYGGVPKMIRFLPNMQMVFKNSSYTVTVSTGVNTWQYIVRPTDCADIISDSDFNPDTLPSPTDPLHAQKVATKVGTIFFAFASVSIGGSFVFSIVAKKISSMKEDNVSDNKTEK